MKLTNNIHQLQIDFEIFVGSETRVPRFVNVLVVLGETITLIDTGVKGSERTIFRYIEAQGRKPDEIDKIILSHAHPDHIGSAARIKELTGCKVLSHEYEKDWVENIDLQNKERPVPGFFKLADTPVAIDDFLAEGQKLKIAENITIKCLLTPGHSKGMLSILFIEDKILFTADAIPLKNDIPNYDNFVNLEKSLDLIKNVGGYSTLLTSWTPAITDSAKMFRLIFEGENYLRKLEEAVKKHYHDAAKPSLDSCKMCVEELGLPPFFVNPIADKAFRSHFN